MNPLATTFMGNVPTVAKKAGEADNVKKVSQNVDTKKLNCMFK